MSPEGLPPPPPPPPRDSRGPGRSFRGDQGMPKWGLWVLLGLTLMVVVLPSIIDTSSKDEISYSEFMAQVRDGDVESVKIDNTNGDITGELSSGAEFSTTGPLDGGIPDRSEERRVGKEGGSTGGSRWGRDS